MKKRSGLYPRVQVDTTASGAVGQAGGVLLTQTIAATGLGAELSTALAPWRSPFAIHDPCRAGRGRWCRRSALTRGRRGVVLWLAG